MSDVSKGIEIVRKGTKTISAVPKTGLILDRSMKNVTLHLVQNREYGQALFLIDCSASMAGYKLKEAKEGILDFARDAIRKEYFLGLIEFSSTATILCKPGQDLKIIDECLKTIHASGGTNMSMAIDIADSSFNDHKCDRAIIIATDGLPNKMEATIKAADRAKSHGIDIIAIGTDDADQEFLRKIASRSDLGKKVPAEHFAQSIASTAQLLSAPKSLKKI
jgi:Mg-chelatase subunit ChlD